MSANCSASLCSIEAEGIFKRCYGSEPQVPDSCDCYYWYGWTGERCDQVSAFLVFERVVSIMFILWSVSIILLTSRTLVANMILGYNPMKGIDPIHYCGLSVIVAIFSFLVFYFHQAVSLFDAKRFQVLKVPTSFMGEGEDIALNNVNVQILSLQMAVTYTGFTYYFLAKALQRAFMNVLRPQSISLTKRIQDWNGGMFLISVLLSVVFTLLSFFGPVDIAVGAYLLVFFTNSLIFVVRTKRFIKIERYIDLDALPPSTRYSVGTTLKLIKLISRLSSVCILAVIPLILTHIGSIFVDQTPGTFSVSPSLRDAGIFLVMLSLSLISWYFTSTTEGVIVLEDYAVCKVFKLWDGMNKRIFPDNDRLVSTQVFDEVDDEGKKR